MCMYNENVIEMHYRKLTVGRTARLTLGVDIGSEFGTAEGLTVGFILGVDTCTELGTELEVAPPLTVIKLPSGIQAFLKKA
jgi:hypothetical protein